MSKTSTKVPTTAKGKKNKAYRLIEQNKSTPEIVEATGLTAQQIAAYRAWVTMRSKSEEKASSDAEARAEIFSDTANVDRVAMLESQIAELQTTVNTNRKLISDLKEMVINLHGQVEQARRGLAMAVDK